jgi:hypothetical protein
VPIFQDEGIEGEVRDEVESVDWDGSGLLSSNEVVVDITIIDPGG